MFWTLQISRRKQTKFVQAIYEVELDTIKLSSSQSAVNPFLHESQPNGNHSQAEFALFSGQDGKPAALATTASTTTKGKPSATKDGFFSFSSALYLKE